MTKLDDQGREEYIAGLLTPEKIRSSAFSCIVFGTTADDLRTGAVAICGGLEAVWLAWADEVEALAVHGVTGESARDAAKVALVAGMHAGSFRRPEAYADVQSLKLWVLLIADEMDALAAEGFDPAAYGEEKIAQARGGAR